MKGAWTPAALSALVYAIITVVIGREVIAHLGSMIANDAGDPLLTAAILKWNATHVPWTDAWYQFPIFYPTRDTLTFSEHLLGLSVIASPIYWLTGDAVATYNVTLLLTYPLCAMTMFALVLRLTGSAAGAFVAGLAFAFSPYRVSQLPHIQMLATFWAPLALIGLHAYLDTGRRRWLVLYGATWVLQGASNGYALVMFSLLVGLWTLWFVVLGRKWQALIHIATASIVAVIPLAPVLYRYAVVHSHFGFSRGYDEIRWFSADIGGLLCAPQDLLLWRWVHVFCRSEGELFPGAALMLLVIAGLAGMIVRSGWTPAAGRLVETYLRRLSLFVATVYVGVIVVLLASGPFRFDIGSLTVQASTLRKPVQVVTISLLLALVLSPGVRAMVRRSRHMGFYVLAAILTWVLTLGPVMTLMGNEGFRGPYYYLMALPGVDSLRVPARFWLMTTICLSIVGGLVVAEFVRGRSRRMTAIAVTVLGLAVLGDGWTGRINVAALPPPVPGASGLTGATVLDAPPDITTRDIQATFRAVDGGWNAVNGYSGFGPSYYHLLVGAGRAEVDALVTPFQSLGVLHVLVDKSAPRLRDLLERQPGVVQMAENDAYHLYRLPQRPLPPRAVPQGERLRPRVLRSECSPSLLPLALDGNESTLWQCGVSDERMALVVDLGDLKEVGAVVQNAGNVSAFHSGGLRVETSEDGSTWTEGWSGDVFERSIAAAMADPKRLRIVIAFSPRRARFLRLHPEAGDPEMPWTIAELEVWSASAETR